MNRAYSQRKSRFALITRVASREYDPNPKAISSSLSRTGAACLPELSINPYGPFRHLSIFNQRPPLTQQLLPN